MSVQGSNFGESYNGSVIPSIRSLSKSPKRDITGDPPEEIEESICFHTRFGGKIFILWEVIPTALRISGKDFSEVPPWDRVV